MSRKVFLGGILFVFACVVLTLLHYNGTNTTFVYRPAEGDDEVRQQQLKQIGSGHGSFDEKVQQHQTFQRKDNLKGMKVQLELLESLKKQGRLVNGNFKAKGLKYIRKKGVHVDLYFLCALTIGGSSGIGDLLMMGHVGVLEYDTAISIISIS